MQQEEKFQIISDGSCDLSQEIVQKNNIRVIPFYVSFDGQTYRKEMVELGVREFYRRMIESPGVFPKTSMPSVEDYHEAFVGYASKGKPILCICITTKFSGSMQSALSAAELVRDEYPGAKITVMDATVNTVLQGLLVMQAVSLRDRGASLPQAAARLEEIKGTGRIFFTIGDISYLRAGGRIGRLTGIAGTLLGVKPVITLKQGEIFPSGVGRSRAKNLQKTQELLLSYLKEAGEDAKNYAVVSGYGDDAAEGAAYRDAVKAAVRPLLGDVEIPLCQIGATIAVHTGPYPLGVGVMRKA